MADDIVLSFNDSLLRQSDLEILRNNEWINDSLITFWFEYLESVKYKEASDRIAFISSEVTQLIKSAATPDSPTRAVVSSILQSLSLPSKELILLPLNDHSSQSMKAGGSHWTLIAASRDQEAGRKGVFTITHLDSMDSDHNSFAASQVARVLRSVIPTDQSSSADAASLIRMECSRQANSHDCGIHVMVNADALCHRLLSNDARPLSQIASQDQVRAMRRDILPQVIRDLGGKGV